MSLYGNVELVGRPCLENVRKLDLLPINQIRRMSRVGISIDLPYLADLSSELGREMVDLQRDIASYIPPDRLDQFATAAAEIEEDQGSATINANSAEQIRSLLFDLLGVGNGKDLKQTAQGKVSTGKKQLELCRDDHPVVPKVLAYRERSKLKSAFADSLPKKAKYHPVGACCPVCELPHKYPTWRVHTQITTTRTETGRLASKSPNLQQIPARTELGARIRAAFVASPGSKLVAADFSQMELRDLAHMANAASMIKIYKAGRDTHIATACSVFDRDYDYYYGLTIKKKKKLPLSDVESTELEYFTQYERMPSKNVNFMIVYGASWKGLQAQLALSGVFWDEQQCQDFINKWFNLYPEVHDYLELQAYRARRYGFVWTPCGRVRLVPEIKSYHSYIRSAGIRQAGNMPIQGCNAEQTKLVMGELDDHLLAIYDNGRGSWVWPLLPIHDEIICEAEEGSTADGLAVLMEHVFSQVMVDKDTGEDYWRVPIKGESSVMERWKK